jgi:hypothetical protein
MSRKGSNSANTPTLMLSLHGATDNHQKVSTYNQIASTICQADGWLFGSDHECSRSKARQQPSGRCLGSVALMPTRPRLCYPCMAPQTITKKSAPTTKLHLLSACAYNLVYRRTRTRTTKSVISTTSDSWYFGPDRVLRGFFGAISADFCSESGIFSFYVWVKNHFFCVHCIILKAPFGNEQGLNSVICSSFQSGLYLFCYHCVLNVDIVMTSAYTNLVVLIVDIVMTSAYTNLV